MLWSGPANNAESVGAGLHSGGPDARKRNYLIILGTVVADPDGANAIGIAVDHNNAARYRHKITAERRRGAGDKVPTTECPATSSRALECTPPAAY